MSVFVYQRWFVTLGAWPVKSQFCLSLALKISMTVVGVGGFVLFSDDLERIQVVARKPSLASEFK
jgi:Tfp pilus assembly protein PilO